MLTAERLLSLPRYLEYVQFQGISPTSRIIQKFTGGQDSHSAVLDREAVDPTRQLIEQWPHVGGIKAWMDWSPWESHTKGTPYEIWSLEVPADCYEWVMNQYRAAAERKEEYDWSGIVGFLGIGRDDPKKTFCSEIMFKHLAQYRNWTRLKPSKVHPTMWGNILECIGAKLTQRGIVD